MQQDKENIEDIILRAKNGDNDAFSYLYETYYAPVYRYVYARLRNRHDAEDLTQTVFIKVYNAMHSYKPGKSDILAFFYRVARNSIIDFWRKKKTVPLDETYQGASSDNPHRDMKQSEASEVIHGALEHLSADQRDTILLSYISGYETEEIGTILHKKDGAVRKMKSRALESLRKHLCNSKYTY